MMCPRESAASGPAGCPCERAANQLWNYLDDELDTPERDRIATHLGHCPACSELMRNDSTLKHLVARACAREAAPAELRAWVTTKFAAWRVEVCGGQATYSRTTVSFTQSSPQETSARPPETG